MKMDLLIRNAILLDPETGFETYSDVGIQNGRIALIQPTGSEMHDTRKEIIFVSWLD